jgi:hypothetical protein
MVPVIQLTTPQILTIAQVCEYSTIVDSHTKIVFKGGDLNQRQARLIYMERKSVLNRYNLNPSDPTLVATSNYLFSLLRNWPAAQNILNAIAGGLAAITNPANVNIIVGANAVFTVAVTSSSPYTVQWYRSGVLIPGATGLSYTLTNAQLTDSGATFSAVATNAAGDVSSLPATLTVTSALTAQWWWGPTDPFPALSGGSDTLSYQISEAITHNAAIVINYAAQSGAENNQFNVLRYPDTENDKTIWVNTSLNQGTIPDSIMRAILTINGFKYVISRNAMSLDPVTTTLTYS